jgi:hypothetical protein
MGWKTEEIWFDSRQSQDVFFFTLASTDLEAIQGTERVSSKTTGIKRLKRETDQSPSFSIEVQNNWSYNSTDPYAFM